MQTLSKAVLALALSLTGASPAGAAPLEVIVPEQGNLQYLSFWIALGSGDLDVTVKAPDSPGDTPQLIASEHAEVAVLPPPLFLRMIADGAPLVAVANLLRNDPIDLVVKRSVAAAHKIDRSLPLKERLERLRGLKLGVAPGPVSRLRALFKSVGLEPTAELVTLMGPEQNQALAEGRVDALYAHTPFLERALALQDCVVVVDQASGEVKELAARQIHVLAVSERLVRERRPLVDKLVQAIARAEKLVHHDRPAALAALYKAVPPKDPEARALTARLLDLYAAAVPDDPAVSAEGLRGALALFPASKQPPDLSHTDLSKHVLTPTPPRR